MKTRLDCCIQTLELVYANASENSEWIRARIEPTIVKASAGHEAPEYQIAVECRYLPPGNVKGSRLLLILPLRNKRKIVEWEAAGANDAREQALAWFKEQGLAPETYLETVKGQVFGFEKTQRPKLFKAFGIV